MFWSNYVYLCDLENKSPNGLAKELGVQSSGTVTKWSKGTTTPRTPLLMKMSDHFGISTDDLLYTDLRAKKMPSPVSGEELSKYATLGLSDLTEEEFGKVEAYIAGLKSSRKK